VLVALADQLEEVVALLGGEVTQAEVVQDQQVEVDQLARPSLPGAVGVPAGQLGQQPGGLGEGDRVAAAAGDVAQRLGQVGLAHAHGAGEDHRLRGRLEDVAARGPADVGVG
jgi:hypothetical protein